MNRALPVLSWILLGLAALVSFYLDLDNTAHGGAIDLRNRITGVRLLESNLDAFHYKWHEGDPDVFCDLYNNPNLPVNKTTVTPTLLLIHAPAAIMPGRLAQFSWFLFQWAMLIGTGVIWLRACSAPWQRRLIAAFIVGFTYTDGWRLHAERGQSYIVLAFFFAWWLTATLDPKRSETFLSGFLAGFLIALRPPFALLLPSLALHRRGQLLGAGAGLLLGVGVPMIMHPATWSEYSSAMHYHADMYIRGIHINPGQQHFPSRIEGIPTDILGNYAKDIPFGEFSAYSILERVHLVPVRATMPWLAPILPSLVALCVGVPFAIWLGWSRRLPFVYIAIGMAAWYFLVDLFLPDYRGLYDDVFIINVLAAAIVTAKEIPWAIWPSVLALPIGWAVYAWVIDRPGLIDLPTQLYTLSAILLLFWFNNRVVSHKVAAAC